MRYLAYKSGSPMHPFEYGYSHVARSFDIPLLFSLREVKDATLAYKLVHRMIDCEALFNLFVPREIYYNLRDFREFRDCRE